MKKILLLLLLITGLSNAQIVNIPDANFKAKLLSADFSNYIAIDLNGMSTIVDTNSDGEIQQSEALLIKGINVYNSYFVNQIVNLTGIEAFTNLEYLNCSNNSLQTINLSQNFNLKDLSCFQNNLLSLDVSNNTQLINLKCSGNQITSLDVSQNLNLSELECAGNELSNLDLTQNINLTSLICGLNPLTSLDLSQNINLSLLDTYSLNLTNLDITNNVNLVELRIINNHLTSLDVTNNIYLQNLDIRSNQVSSINLANNPDLESFYCTYNNLTNIDVSQNTNLVSLWCDYNLLTTLDITLNTNLTSLYCNNNQLGTLFIKNGKIESPLNFSNNPNLQYICADEGQVASIQAQAGLAVMVSSYCSFTPGGNYNSVAGVVRFDMDNNGCDASDLMLPNSVRLNLTNGTVSSGTFPTTDGSYTLYTTTGNHTLSTLLENPTYFSITPISTTLSFPTLNNSVYNQDFCITPVGVHPDVEIIIVPIEIARPGFDAIYQIVYKNKGNQTMSGSINFQYNDAVLDFTSATINPDSQNLGSLTWNYTNLLPFESRSFYIILNVNTPTETPAVNIGDVLSYSATINPVSGDETITDNTFTYNQIVVGSFDPNNKVCLEGNVVSPTEIGDYLHYNINFENTGTFPATFVVVKDIIDTTKFDIATLQVLNASHQMETRIAGNKVEFIFDDINLGTNQHGNVVFKIKTKAILVEGNVVTNNANIYFDYNFPIETNTTSTTFQTLSNGEFPIDSSVVIAPNPTKNNVNINCNSNIQSIQLFDVQGRVLMTQLVNDSQSSIDISNYTNGIYFVKVLTDEGSKVERISKE
ncbi:MAG: T9SS type A sorting domain-containing protein [Flavobacteriales bacterium]|nr:T9SS type A sorting domain-containing protein [Flavobacteriales bacterium]